MYKMMLPLIAVGLSACGGSSTTDPTNFIINTPTGTPLSTTTAKSFTQTSASSPYTIGAGGSAFTLTRTNTAAAHLSTYSLVIGGVTYNLAPQAGNSSTSTNNSFVGTVGATTATVFLNENKPNASIANIQLKTSGASEELFGIVGNATPTSALTSTASYAGIGEISVDRAGASPTFDDAPASTVNMSVDFGAGSLSGTFNVSDAAGDAGGIDIAGSTTLPFTGTVSGNTFSANVDYTNLVGITTNLNSVTAANPVEGGFYGPNGENAVGVGLSLGQSSVANDVVIYTRIQADKQ